MTQNKDFYKLLAAAGLGMLGGVLLSGYLTAPNAKGIPLSKHLETLSKLLQQVENIETDDAQDIKKRIQNILTDIETNYAKPKE